MVFQHFSLFEALTVQENIALGPEHRRRNGSGCASGSCGFPTNMGCRWIRTGWCTICRSANGSVSRSFAACCKIPKLLIMDEPTSVLTPSEVQKLFVTLRRLAAEGCSILYISHKLEEVRALCSAATIMRLGKNVARL